MLLSGCSCNLYPVATWDGELPGGASEIVEHLGEPGVELSCPL